MSLTCSPVLSSNRFALSQMSAGLAIFSQNGPSLGTSNMNTSLSLA
ncbi:MAG: hypothetical protein BWY99_01695 [Synergistetes bacterium ADurb.BinA166]|nr:MAG: hypothetical protein BWY99_01695 [Synergistetes bacterium ADurb.BinA166]